MKKYVFFVTVLAVSLVLSGCGNKQADTDIWAENEEGQESPSKSGGKLQTSTGENNNPVVAKPESKKDIESLLERLEKGSSQDDLNVDEDSFDVDDSDIDDDDIGEEDVDDDGDDSEIDNL